MLDAIFSFFFQAEDGIRDATVTGVQTCALPISLPRTLSPGEAERLIDAANGTTPRAMRDRALVELMYGAGLRVSEATGLDRRSVDLEERLLPAPRQGPKEAAPPPP